MGRHHAIVLGRHHDRAAGAAEPAGRLVPLELRQVAVGDEVLRLGRDRNAGGRRGGGHGL